MTNQSQDPQGPFTSSPIGEGSPSPSFSHNMRVPESGNPAAIPNPLGTAGGLGPSPEAKRRKGTAPAAWIVATAIVGGILFGGVAGGGTALLLSNQDGRTQVAESGTSTGAEGVSTSITERVRQSVVTVNVEAADAAGSGSGVAVASGGYLVTNNHVVSLDGQATDARITVTTADGRILAAELVGTDPAADLAVLRVDADLPVLEFAAEQPAVGEQAIAVGAPLGLSNTVTEGIVSAIGRGLAIGSAEPDEESPYRFWSQQGPEEPQQTIAVPVLQTDAPINPGNSGGALVDAEGRLIGINVAIATAGDTSTEEVAGSIGIGFAIEGELVQRVVEEIIADGSATHGQLGATVSDQTDPEIGVSGAMIQEVIADGAADSAGLVAGDVITAVEGRPVGNATDLTAFVRSAAAGSEVELNVLRDGAVETVAVQLGTL